MKRVACIIAASVIAIGASVASAVTVAPGVNLIHNPDAELGSHSVGPADTVIVAWEDGLTYGDTTAGNVNTAANTTTYAANYAGMGTPTAPGLLVGNQGAAYFYASEDAGDYSVTQTVNVSSLSSLIDSGGAQYITSGFFGGFSTQGDIGRLTATFRDAGNASLGSVTIGPATHGLGSTVFTKAGDTGLVPVGTTSILFSVDFDQQGGSNDSRADNLSFVIANAPAVPTPAAAWQFNGNLDNDIAGGAALVNNIPGGVFTIATIDGQSAQVLDLPRATTLSQTMVATNPIGSNGGGTLTNDYTLAFDVNFPTFPGTGSFASLLETNPANSDDVDFFVRANGNVDLESAAQVPAGIKADTWYRLVITNERVGANNLTMLYLDGLFIGQATNTIDGDTALENLFLLFSDNTGDTSRTLVNSVALWDGALDGLQVARLGAANAQGLGALAAPTVPVPEPATASLALLGLGLMMRRRRGVRA
ncbi:MAG: PEP-CTERM sorting domain-containing protein [Phycisphaeraceae bacterium]